MWEHAGSIPKLHRTTRSEAAVRNDPGVNLSPIEGESMHRMRQRLIMITLAALSLTMAGCAALPSWWPWSDDARVTQIALSSPESSRLPGITSGDSLSHVLALLGPPQIRWTPAGYPAAGGRWEWISPEHDVSAPQPQYRHRMIEFDASGKVSSVREWYTKEPPGASANARAFQETPPPTSPSRSQANPPVPAERQADSPRSPLLAPLLNLLRAAPKPPAQQPQEYDAPPNRPATLETPGSPPAPPLSQTEIGPAAQSGTPIQEE